VLGIKTFTSLQFYCIVTDGASVSSPCQRKEALSRSLASIANSTPDEGYECPKGAFID